MILVAKNNKRLSKQMKVRYNVSNFLFFVFIFSVSCFNRNSTISIDGVTMGTKYSIKITDFNNEKLCTPEIFNKFNSSAS